MFLQDLRVKLGIALLKLMLRDSSQVTLGVIQDMFLQYSFKRQTHCVHGIFLGFDSFKSDPGSARFVKHKNTKAHLPKSESGNSGV